MWDELFAVQNETKNVKDNSIVSALVNSIVHLAFGQSSLSLCKAFILNPVGQIQTQRSNKRYRRSSWTVWAWKCTALSQSQRSFSNKKSCDWLRTVHFHAKIVHVRNFNGMPKILFIPCYTYVLPLPNEQYHIMLVVLLILMITRLLYDIRKKMTG